MKYFVLMIVFGAFALNVNCSRAAQFVYSEPIIIAQQQEELLEEPETKKAPAKETKQEPKKEETKEQTTPTNTAPPAPAATQNTPSAQPAPTGQKVEEMEVEEMDDVPRTEDEKLKYYKEKHVFTLNSKFVDVWNAIKGSITEFGCQILKDKQTQSDEGFYKGIINSDYCVFAEGEDSTFKQLKLYSFKMPVIRGGVWTTGRMQYKFNFIENKDNTVTVTLKGELSGFEKNVTYQVHFWESSGYFETKMINLIKTKLGAVKKKK